MAVMIDRIRVKNSSTIRILVMNSPPLTMLASARPMSDAGIDAGIEHALACPARPGR